MTASANKTRWWVWQPWPWNSGCSLREVRALTHPQPRPASSSGPQKCGWHQNFEEKGLSWAVKHAPRCCVCLADESPPQWDMDYSTWMEAQGIMLSVNVLIYTLHATASCPSKPSKENWLGLMGAEMCHLRCATWTAPWFWQRPQPNCRRHMARLTALLQKATSWSAWWTAQGPLALTAAAWYASVQMHEWCVCSL